MTGLIAPHVQTRRPKLDHTRVDYARRKLGQGYPLRAVAQMVGSCEADLRSLVVKPPPEPPPKPAAPDTSLAGLPPAIAEIIRQVSAAHDIAAPLIMNPRERSLATVTARQEVMWTIYELRNANDGKRRFSTTGIARILNLKCHSAVSVGVRAHARRLAA